MTILEQLQSAFPDVEGIGDARNIAEALAMISGAGGRGANAIADKVSNPGEDVEGVWDWVAENGVNAVRDVSEVIGTKAQYIGSHAFAYCAGLKSVSFPNASYIGSSAFCSCAGLTSVSFPNVSYIEGSAFQSCSGLTSVSFPKVTDIGVSAFCYCSNLVTISFPNASYIGDYAFQECSGLTSVTFPNASYVGEYAFQFCNSLIDASFQSVSDIGSFAFYYCTSLTTASFPNVSTIGSCAFQGCKKLISLYLTDGNMSEIPALDSAMVFDSTPIGGYSASAGQYGSIYVPASLYSAFLTAENWSFFSSRIVSVPES